MTKDQATQGAAFDALLAQIQQANITIAQQASQIAGLRFDLQEAQKQAEPKEEA